MRDLEREKGGQRSTKGQDVWHCRVIRSSALRQKKLKSGRWHAKLKTKSELNKGTIL